MNPFQIIVLGSTGGPLEDDLSSYLLVDKESKQALALDAGSLLHGLKVAYEKGALADFRLDDPQFGPLLLFLRKYLAAYLISHSHLDHLLGLVCASQIDSPKSIYGSDETIDHLRDHLFNQKIWSNFGNEGKDAIQMYKYVRLKWGNEVPIAGTRFKITAFPLNHAPTLSSTAFLINLGENYVLYFGDTSSDFVEKEKRNTHLWEKVAPLFREKKLKGIFLECSYPEMPAGASLYGHLSPSLLIQELENFQKIAKSPLKDLSVIITHRKISLRKDGDSLNKIEEELRLRNKMEVNFIFPSQGTKIEL